MILVLCTDDRLKTAFSGKRQSTDRALRTNLISLSEGRPIRMNRYSRSRFTEPGNYVVSEDFLKTAGPGQICFAEGHFELPTPERVEKLILYRWNRAYPGDEEMPTEYLHCFALSERADFKGFSHERITREVYVK